MQNSLLSPKEIKESYPQCHTDTERISRWRNEIIDILTGVDQRLLLIVGPCAIHRADAALEYAEKLTRLAHDVKDAFLIIMRAYVEKSRTKGGWKQP